MILNKEKENRLIKMINTILEIGLKIKNMVMELWNGKIHNTKVNFLIIYQMD